VENGSSERALADRLITAEQDERRRLALFLHDGPVQSLAGIAHLLDAVTHAIEDGRPDEAKRILGMAIDRHRQTIRELRDLSFSLEPVVLRDQGLGVAVRALAEQLGMASSVQIDLDIEQADSLAEKAQVVVYQILHDALNQSVRRQARRIGVRICLCDNGEVEVVVDDDGTEERRHGTIEALDRRAQTLSGQAAAERVDGGTIVRVTLPAYAAQG
jgi:signal transduction histidine kinase